MITGAPVGHGIGMLAALLIPVYRRSEIHLIDVWDPGPRAAGDARRRLVGRARARRSSSRACSTIPTTTPSGTLR